jgi:hypothetical protein
MDVTTLFNELVVFSKFRALFHNRPP